MKNFVESGRILTLTAPNGGVVSGQAYKIGSLVVVATVTAAQGEPFAAITEGVVEHAKTSAQAWSEGEKIYFDTSPPEFTTASGGNTLCGVAAAAAANPSATGLIRLDGVAR